MHDLECFRGAGWGGAENRGFRRVEHGDVWMNRVFF